MTSRQMTRSASVGVLAVGGNEEQGVAVKELDHHQPQQQGQQGQTAAVLEEFVRVKSQGTMTQQQLACNNDLQSACTDHVFTLSPHVLVNFDDIFVQPEAVNSGDIGQHLSRPVRRLFSLVFIYTQESIYYFVSVVCGLLLAVMWGSVFGLLDLLTVWMFQPVITVYLVVLRTVAAPFRATVRAVFDALFESIGQTFRYINVKSSLTVHQQQLLHQSAGTQPHQWLGFV